MSESFLSRNIPRYQLLAEQLITGIVNGEFPVGECLPTEYTLRNQYNVSRFTIREAMKILKDKGLIVTRRGVGSEVISQKITDDTYSFSSDSYIDFMSNAQTTRLIDVKYEDIECDEAIAKIMKCKVGQKTLKVLANRQVYQVDAPFIVSQIEVYIIGSYAAIKSQIGEQQAISKMIESRFGVVTAEIKQRITPIIVNQETAKILGVEEGSPGLKITRLYYNTEGEIFEYVINYHAGIHGEVSMNIKRT